MVSQQFDKHLYIFLYLTTCLNVHNHNTCIHLPQKRVYCAKDSILHYKSSHSSARLRARIFERLTNFLAPFFRKYVFETVKIRIFVNMASKFRKLRIFVNAILETVKIRIFVNMADFSP